jgi:hypothetical protein
MHPIMQRPLAQWEGDADGGFESWRRRSDEVVRYPFVFEWEAAREE